MQTSVQDISTQVLAQPKAFAVAASLLLGIGIIPGLPTDPFLLMAFLVGGLAYLLMRGKWPKRKGTQKMGYLQSNSGCGRRNATEADPSRQKARRAVPTDAACGHSHRA